MIYHINLSSVKPTLETLSFYFYYRDLCLIFDIDYCFTLSLYRLVTLKVKGFYS